MTLPGESPAQPARHIGAVATAKLVTPSPTRCGRGIEQLTASLAPSLHMQGG